MLFYYQYQSFQALQTVSYTHLDVYKRQTSYSWDDSLVTDRKAEFAEKFQLVQGEILGADEFREWYTGEDIETARQNLPQSKVEE